jgi:hypothetical protein
MKALTKLRPAPADFAQYAYAETMEDLITRYKVGNRAIYRWRAELGLIRPGKPPRKVRPMPDGFISHAKGKSIHDLARFYKAGDESVKRWLGEAGLPTSPRPSKRPGNYAADRDFKSSFEPTIDPSVAGQAQRFLQKLGPVYRASVISKDREGWMVHGKPMSDNQMMNFAQKKGWTANAFLQVSAC